MPLPIGLIPEFLPVIGPLDDVVVVALAFRYAARQIPRSVVLDAWPGKPSAIERLLGPARHAPSDVDDNLVTPMQPTRSSLGDLPAIVPDARR